MTPGQAVSELAKDAADPDEVAKRLWEAGVLMHSNKVVDFGDMTYCPIARYIRVKSGVVGSIRIGVESWYVRESRFRGHLPRVLKEFVQQYDSGVYDNLVS